MLAHLDELPAPQRDALRIAFGISGGAPPDRVRATGETAHKRTGFGRPEGLTAQEAQIARLAGTGCPTRRSAPGCSSAPAPSSTTWARC